MTTRRTGLSISFSKDGGAYVIGRGIALDLVHGLAHADLGRQVDHAVHALQRAGDRVGVAYVTVDELGVLVQRFGTRCRLAVALRDQRIQHADLMAATQQLVGDKAADKACAAGNQNLFHLVPFFPL